MPTAKAYGKAPLSQINFTSDTIKVRLTNTAPDQDAHQFLSDAGSAVGTDQTLASKTATYDAATNAVVWDAADSTWSALTGTFRYAVVYKDTGTAATSPLIAYTDFDSAQSPSAQDVTVAWASDGIVRNAAA